MIEQMRNAMVFMERRIGDIEQKTYIHEGFQEQLDSLQQQLRDCNAQLVQLQNHLQSVTQSTENLHRMIVLND